MSPFFLRFAIFENKSHNFRHMQSFHFTPVCFAGSISSGGGSGSVVVAVMIVVTFVVVVVVVVLMVVVLVTQWP